MTDVTKRMSLRTAALVAGFAILAMAVAAPFAEIYAYPKLVDPHDAAGTARNILANRGLFVSAILAYAFTFLLDVVAAWALYVLMRPVHSGLSMLTAWFRLVYAVIALLALSNLVTVYQLLDTPDYAAVFGQEPLHAQVRLALGAFKNTWSFGILIFGIHLVLLGGLVLESSYIPRILGALLVLAGLGYAITSLGPLVLPGAGLDIARFTFVGELVFMLWLVVKGGRIREVGSGEARRAGAA